MKSRGVFLKMRSKRRTSITTTRKTSLVSGMRLLNSLLQFFFTRMKTSILRKLSKKP
jgi:hypothetical protein